jgi:DnaK suppressor protein
MTILTQDALLNMPESDYMNPEQLSFFTNLLETQKQEIISGISDIKDSLQSNEKNSDMTDIATVIEQQQLDLKRTDRERKLLNKISKTLKLIESGEYGYCDETGEPIGLRRLLARPTTTLSIEAKQQQEFKERTIGQVKSTTYAD